MKKIFGLIGIFALVLTGCSGEDGRDGLDGDDAAMALVFETTQSLSYDTASGLWISNLVNFQDNEVIPQEQDVVLAYRLERVTDAGEDIWSQLPQNFFLEAGTIQYIFNFNVNGADANKSAEFVIDGDYDLTGLDAGFTANQTFRVVIVPAAVAQTLDSNSADLNTVMKNLNLSNSDIKTLR